MEVLSQTEGAPGPYPDTPPGLSTKAAALDPETVWMRIEAYTVVRFAARSVIWTVEGPGEFVPGLRGASVTGSELWDGSAWGAVTLDAGPLGGVCLPGDGPYRITADVAAAPVDAPVAEAFKRLAEYLAEDPITRGASSFKYHVGPLNIEQTRNPAYMARAMQNSGAGDLLRPYRRV